MCLSQPAERIKVREIFSPGKSYTASWVPWPRTCPAKSDSSHIVCFRTTKFCAVRDIPLLNTFDTSMARKQRNPYPSVHDSVGRVHSMNVKCCAMANSTRLYRVAQPNVEANCGIQHPSCANAVRALRDLQKQNMLQVIPLLQTLQAMSHPKPCLGPFPFKDWYRICSINKQA